MVVVVVVVGKSLERPRGGLQELGGGKQAQGLRRGQGEHGVCQEVGLWRPRTGGLGLH